MRSQDALHCLPHPADVTIAPEGFDAWRNIFRAIQGREVWSIYGAWVETNRPQLGPGIRERMAYAATVYEEGASLAYESLAVARASIRALVPPGTVTVTSTDPADSAGALAVSCVPDDTTTLVAAVAPNFTVAPE